MRVYGRMEEEWLIEAQAFWASIGLAISHLGQGIKGIGIRQAKRFGNSTISHPALMGV